MRMVKSSETTKSCFLNFMGLILITVISSSVYSQTFVNSVGNTNWSTPATWNPSQNPAPGTLGNAASQTLLVSAVNTITLDQDINISTGNFIVGFTGTVGAGTISVSKNSKTVIGSGTAFLTDFSADQLLLTSSGAVIGEIASISTNTSLTLKADWLPNPSSGIAYFKNNTSPISSYTSNNVTDASGGTAYKLNMINGSFNAFQNTLVIKSGITTFEGLATLTNANLYVEKGATLILGGLTLTTNGSIYVYVAKGATLIINGNVQDDNTGGLFTVGGYVQINGNYVSSVGNVEVGDAGGTFQTTGSMTTTGNSTIYGSVNNCPNGPCSGSALACADNTKTAYASSVSPLSQVLCVGQTILPISFSTNAPATLSYQWQKSTTNGGSGFLDINSTNWPSDPTVGATTASYTPPQPSGTVYYRMKYTTTSCPGATLYSPSSQISLNNAAAPVAGSIAGGGITLCSTTNSTNLLLTGYTGSGFQWQSSSNNTTFTDITGATSTAYTATNVSATTYYRVVVSNGACNTATASSVSITI